MRTILFFCLSFMVSTIQAQDVNCQKIGFADTQYIAANMPEFKEMEAELVSLGGHLANQLKSKYMDYESKLNTYQKSSPSMSADIRKEKETELIRLQESIQKFERDAELSYRKKQEQLMSPIYLKIGKSIDQVATENKYSIIINADLTAGQELILFSERKFDITGFVLKKMGISVKDRSE